MDEYIEVSGESTLIVTMAEAGAQLALTVRGAQAETALREAAQARAIAAARSKAATLAAEAGIVPGAVAQIEELAAKPSASGAYGDHDWPTVGVMAGAAAAAGADEPPLDPATRRVKLRYRVRLRIGAA